MGTLPTKTKRKRAMVFGSAVALFVVGGCLWFTLVGPYFEGRGRVSVATRFLEAYTQGDCARALTLLDRPEDLPEVHEPAYTDLATFCTNNAIHILHSDPPRDVPIYADIESLGGDVLFDGIFLMTDPNGDTYPCPQLAFRVDRRRGRLTVVHWDERWARPASGPYSCARLLSLDPSSRQWPDCSERSGIARRLNMFNGSPVVPYELETGTPGIALLLKRIDDNTIEVAADGLKPEGIHYIFFAATLGDSQLPGKDFPGIVPFYSLNGETVAFPSGRSTATDPWVAGRFTYRIESLPTLPAGSAMEVRLVHPGGVVCKSLPAR